MTPRAKFWLAATLPLWLVPWSICQVCVDYFRFARHFVDVVWSDE